MQNVNLEVAIWNTLKERLALAYNLEDDDEALLSTLQGELPLTDVIVKMVREAKQAEAFAEGLKTIIADNQARKRRFEDKAEKLRGLAAWAMGEINMTRLQEADVTVSMRMGKPTLVIDAVEEPGPMDRPYITMKEVYSWSKVALRDAIEAGNDDALAIAHMSNPKPILTVRTK